MSRRFEMPVTSVFHIRGQGLILGGVVSTDTVRIGDRLTVRSPLAAKSGVVAGLERLGTRELIDTANAADAVAICFRDVAADDIPDGIERVDQYGWKAVNLTVASPESAWSRWWKRIFGTYEQHFRPPGQS